jgi:nucleoside-diphosphate-sugar epimerase
MKILIAGGGGYLGSRILDILTRSGHEIEVLDLFWFGNYLPKNIKAYKKDVLEADEALLKNFDQVIFVAGLSNDPMAEFSPSMNFISNAAGPAYLAYMSKKAGVKRFIYASSGSVYGMTGKKLLTEDTLPASTNPYGISKAQGEYAVMHLAGKNFSVISFRNGTMSGFSPRMRFDLIVNTMYMRAMTEKRLVINNPSIWRPILALSDAEVAYKKAVEASYSLSGIYNLSSGNFSVGDVGSAIEKHFKSKHNIDLKIEVNHTNDLRDYAMSTDKITKDLGVKTWGTIESILEELDLNFKKDFDFTSEKYYNIQVFKKLFQK